MPRRVMKNRMDQWPTTTGKNGASYKVQDGT